MRLLVFPLLLLAAAPSRPPVAQPPRPLVILVHGRGQLGTDSAALRTEWKRDLDSALASAGLPALRNDEVRLAWYADVLDPAVEGSCERPYATDADLAGVARGFLVSLASLVPDGGEEDRQARSMLGDMLYLVDPTTRCAAEARFGSLLTTARSEGRPVVVVAYSLGAVVAYEHLNRAPAADSGRGVQLITLGAPLGVPIARELLRGDAGPLRVPPSVSRWVNVYDPDDAFAAPLGLAGGAFADRPAQARTTADPHWAGRYLRDGETGAALARALCEATRGDWSDRCASLKVPAPPG